MNKDNIEYYKECFKNHICPKCGLDLDEFIDIEILECDYCEKQFHPLKKPYSMKFDNVFK